MSVDAEHASSRRSAWGLDLDPDAQAWRGGALCAQIGGDHWFPEKGGSTREAKRVCRACPVTAECLAYALDHVERYGVWGGYSERERRKLARQHRTHCRRCGAEWTDANAYTTEQGHLGCRRCCHRSPGARGAGA